MAQTARSAQRSGSIAPMSSRRARPPAAGAEPKRLAGRHRPRTAAAPRDEERLLDLEEEVAALVRRRTVDAEPDAHACVRHPTHGSDAGAEAQVRRRAVRDAGARLREAGDLAVREVDAVRAPDVPVEPAEAVEVLDRRAAVELAQYSSSSTVSARCVCSFSPSRRASSADSVISRPVTENGEQGATAIWTRAPGPISCSSPASRSVSARTASISSTRARPVAGRRPRRRGPSSRARRRSGSRAHGPPAPRPRRNRSGRAEDVVVVEAVVQPESISSAILVRAAAYSASASIRAQVG